MTILKDIFELSLFDENDGHIAYLGTLPVNNFFKKDDGKGFSLVVKNVDGLIADKNSKKYKLVALGYVFNEDIGEYSSMLKVIFPNVKFNATKNDSSKFDYTFDLMPFNVSGRAYETEVIK